MRMVNRIALVACCFLVLAANAAAQEVLWRIGEFDESSNEFRIVSRDYNDPAADPVFRVGQSTPGEDWQRFHPGPANGMAGGRLHPFTVLFDHAGPPSGVYQLKMRVMYETPRQSFLRVELNGHSGLVYFHPKLDYSGGDWEGTFVPHTSSDTRVIDFPAEWVKQGENRLVLTALDEPDTVEKTLGSIAPGHTGIVYDALQLSHAPRARYAADRVEVRVTPTVFYRQRGERLMQVVEAYATFARMPVGGRVQLEVNGARYDKEFKSDEQFGDQRFEFEVPEWTGTTRATFRVPGAGAERRFPLRLTAGKKWTVFVVPHEHLDIGFTDYPGKVAELHSKAVDEATEAMRRVPDFRWTLDGFWVVEQYLAGRSPEKQREFLENLRRQRVIMPLQYSNQHTGTASLEGLARQFYDAHFFARKHDIPITYAHNVDVPSYTWSYASVLNEAGVKYFLAASNNWRAPMLLHGRWNEKSPFWWEGPDGGRVLMWYSRAYLQLHTMFGGPPSVAAARDALPVYLQAYERPTYKASSTILFGSQLENTVFSREQADFPGLFHQEYAWPKLQFASVSEAMEQIEKEFGGEFAVVRGDLGPYWEDGFGSDALPTGQHRGNQQRILSAEKMATVPQLLDDDLRPDLGLLRSAWKNTVLFDEHTWTYVSATTQPEHEQTVLQNSLKRARVSEAQRQIAESLHRSWGQWESLLAAREPSVVVFNALNWPRGGVVTMDLNDGTEIVDPATGNPVEVEVMSVGRGTPLLPGFGGGYRRVRFVAQDVPAMGYKVYTLRAGATPEPPAAATPGNTIENRYYRVVLDPDAGAIRSVFDKELNRELVDAESPYRFGAYVYVTGGDDMPNNSLYRYGAGLKPPALTPHPAGQGRITGIRRSALGTVVTMTSSAPNTPVVRTEITLRDDEKKIELKYDISKERVLSKEAVYIAFPFAAEAPSFTFGNQTGWVNPAQDRVYGGSLEWHTVTHWAAVHEKDFSAAVVPLDAPLVTFGDIVRGQWPTEFKLASGAVFSWLMNNYWGTNFLAWQGGDFTFRYVLFSGRALDAPSLTRRGWESLTPLEHNVLVANTEPTKLPNTAASLLNISGGLVLNTWKSAEEGEGTILRLQEIEGRPGVARISSDFLHFERAWRTSLLEEEREPLPVQDGSVELKVRPFEIITMRVTSRPASPRTHGRGED